MSEYSFEKFTCVIDRNGWLKGCVPKSLSKWCRNSGLIWFEENRVVLIDNSTHKIYRDYWKERSLPGASLHMNVSRIAVEYSDLEGEEDLWHGIWALFDHYQHLNDAANITVELQIGKDLLPEPRDSGEHVDIRLLNVASS